jgi:hypothetical protein
VNLVRDFDQLSSFSSKFSNKFGCGSSCRFQTDEIDCEFMNENKYDCVSTDKDRLVDLGAASGFENESESLPVRLRSEGMWPCVHILNTAAVKIRSR